MSKFLGVFSVLSEVLNNRYGGCLTTIIGKFSTALHKTYEPRHDKTNKVTVHPAKTQISLGICPVWSESSLYTQWVAKEPRFLHADSEDSDQPGWMPRLIWVFAGRTLILLVLSCHGSIMLRIITLPKQLLWIPTTYVFMENSGKFPVNNHQMSCLMTKQTKWHGRPVKTQISLGVRPVNGLQMSKDSSRHNCLVSNVRPVNGLQMSTDSSRHNCLVSNVRPVNGQQMATDSSRHNCLVSNVRPVNGLQMATDSSRHNCLVSNVRPVNGQQIQVDTIVWLAMSAQSTASRFKSTQLFG